MNHYRLGHYLILLGLILNFIGCVGTVQNAKTPSTKIVADPKTELGFSGIFSAEAISHNRIEVFFYPATGGSGKYDYIIQVGENPIPVTVPSEVLLPDYRGLLKYTITGLERGLNYYLKMEAYDQDGLAKSTNDVVKIVSTFSNVVADFKGISSVYNAPGAEGLDSIKVRWTLAKKKYDNFGGEGYEGDAKYYEVIAVDSNRHNPSSLDNRSLNSSQGRWVKAVPHDSMVNEATLNGLPSNTKFYVRVRAIHYGTLDDINNPNMRGERNSDYLSISTLNADLSAISFKDFKATRNTGVFQTNTMKLDWKPVTGIFEHLRVYWVNEVGKSQIMDQSVILDPATSGLCTSSLMSSNFSCKKLESSATNTIITNLNPSTNYYFRLVACQDAECTLFAMSEVIEANTFPTLAGFKGLTSIKSAQSIDEIGSFTLTYGLPDFSEGFFDGFVIGFKESKSETEFYKLSEDEPLPGDLELTILPFDYDESGKITITGIDYSAVDKGYCFTIYPYILKADNTKDTDTYKEGYPWVCAKPELKGPTKEEFKGAEEAATQGSTLQMYWSTPGIGIYSKFEVFLKKPSTPLIFNFQTAINHYDSWVSNPTFSSHYIRQLLGPNETSAIITNLPNGTYDVGVITYHGYQNTPVRSEFNTKIFRCVINSAAPRSECLLLE